MEKVHPYHLPGPPEDIGFNHLVDLEDMKLPIQIRNGPLSPPLLTATLAGSTKQLVRERDEHQGVNTEQKVHSTLPA